MSATGFSLKSSLCAAILMAYAGSALAQQAGGNAPADTLQTVIDKAITTHPEIRARANDMLSTLEGQNVARGALRPEVNANGWVGKEWRSHVPDSSSYNWNRPGWSVELRQLIYDGWSSVNNVRQLGFEKLSGYYELLATIDNLATEASLAYLDVQRYREMERLARDNFNIHEQTLAHLRERSMSGVGRGVDLEQANGRLALAQSNLMTESGNLNDVAQRYRRVVGEFPATHLAAVPDMATFLPTPEVKDFAGSVRINPSLLSKQALVQAAEAGVESARGNFQPTLEFLASTGRDRETNAPASRDIQSSRVQLRMSYNLYRGGADAARVRQTSAQQYAAQDVRDYTCRNVSQELSIAWNTVERLRAQMPYLVEHELATSKVRTAYQQQFQIGQRSLLDLLDTENELFDARRALTNAQFNLRQAEIQWLALSHKVLPMVGLSPNQVAPEEDAKLLLPDEVLEQCRTPVPDNSNLAPVAVTYRDGMAPPVLTPIQQNGAGAGGW
ncbi:TolC family outer membrane protein [Corticimicrobacter populi]|uniref:Type I secretion protein TolC n=1 Tax=Corticimicrobacter populi TaxID=2175229 RepID=A0A2V1JXL0_9BURK|nr:TolC family outer membrane protein [Corticimicrobacter populi]PWF21738.1 hypothetical protein DD235_13085 [Corticimicrobacter populi]